MKDEKTLSIDEYLKFSTMENPVSSAEHLARYNCAVELAKDKVVLDAGCGLGFGADLLANYAKKVIGIDFNPEVIKYTRKRYYRYNLEFLVMDCTNLGFAENSFDLVCSFEVIEHSKDVHGYCDGIRRVLKPSGFFYLSTPNRRIRDLSGQPICRFHEKEYYLEELRELLNTYFQDIEIFCLVSNVKKAISKTIEENRFRRLIAKLDIFHIRRLLPQKMRMRTLNFITGISSDSISVQDFIPSKQNVENTRTFLARCRKAE